MSLDSRLSRLEHSAPAREVDANKLRRELGARLDGIAQRIRADPDFVEPDTAALDDIPCTSRRAVRRPWAAIGGGVT